MGLYALECRPFYFEDRCNLDQLEEINWDAVRARRWSGRDIAESLKEGKQAEFLMRHAFPWNLFERVGVRSRAVAQQVSDEMRGATHRPVVEIQSGWYY